MNCSLCGTKVCIDPLHYFVTNFVHFDREWSNIAVVEQSSAVELIYIRGSIIFCCYCGITRYLMARWLYSFVCILHHLIIIIMHRYQSWQGYYKGKQHLSWRWGGSNRLMLGALISNGGEGSLQLFQRSEEASLRLYNISYGIHLHLFGVGWAGGWHSHT